MNRQVQIYIEGERIELFNDEKISINSSVQNISDISKTFTDFSQSFTIPASNVNNKIFKHFYNNDLDNDLDYNIKRAAAIEIDLIPFRTGKIKLDGCTLKNGQVENYKITFYGELVTLKDLFGEDKLSSLDYSAYTHAYTGTEVQTRVSSDSIDYDVRYPLISSKRLWQYGSTGTNDVSINSGAIHFNELFPALRVSKIFNEIANKYGISFTGTFLSNKRFTDVFLYLKNKETFKFWTNNEVLDFNTASSGGGFGGTLVNASIFDVVNNKLKIQATPAQADLGAGFQILLGLNSTLSTTDYIVDLYENDVLVASKSYTGTTGTSFIYSGTFDTTYKEYQLKIRADNPCTVSYPSMQAIFSWIDPDTGNNFYNQINCTINNTTLTSSMDIQSLMPDIKVADFFSGILKQFNMTCIPSSTTSYQLIPLETWYALGTTIDVTKYAENSEVTISTMPLYKKISFEHEQSQSFMNRKFYDLYTREYGDLSSTFEYDGGEYVIKLPFENLEFNKFTGIPLQVGYCLTPEPDYKPYIPKPILLYKYDKQSVSFKFNTGTSTNSVSTYIPFGQDLLSGGINYSLNFGNEQSTLLNEIIDNSIYSQYYSDYLTNLYKIKNRIVNLKLVLPVSVLSKIKLNDKLVIRDKRYIINNLQIDLTSGVVNIEMYHDFRSLSKAPK